MLWTKLPEEAISPLNRLHRRLQHALKPATGRRSHCLEAQAGPGNLSAVNISISSEKAHDGLTVSVL